MQTYLSHEFLVSTQLILLGLLLLVHDVGAEDGYVIGVGSVRETGPTARYGGWVYQGTRWTMPAHLMHRYMKMGVNYRQQNTLRRNNPILQDWGISF